MAAPSPPAPPFLLPLLLLVLATTSSTVYAQVPAKSTFKYVNEGDYGDYITEYSASYRTTIDIFAAPFQLMWYNATPGQYYVGLRMGLRRSESLFRWVWDANRGRPVGENATLTFGRDGNLVLAEADGTVAWSTNTANKGVVGLKLLPTGNLVLYNKKGKYLWQSFDHPTDTLFVGQSLYVQGGGPNKLVSRRSEIDNSDGKYSLILEPEGLFLYITGTSSGQLRYSGNSFASVNDLANITFAAEPQEGTTNVLQIWSNGGLTSSVLSMPKFNATSSILRLEEDGSLVVYTYTDVSYQAWDRTYAYFTERNGDLPACDLPSKCGSLGVCEKEMCVGCPTRNGLMAWNNLCAPPMPPACNGANPSRVAYYKVSQVESFLPWHNKVTGVAKLEECRLRCTRDCNCLGFYHWEESSSCWLAPMWGTLSKVSNSSHNAYIKYTI